MPTEVVALSGRKLYDVDVPLFLESSTVYLNSNLFTCHLSHCFFCLSRPISGLLAKMTCIFRINMRFIFIFDGRKKYHERQCGLSKINFVTEFDGKKKVHQTKKNKKLRYFERYTLIVEICYNSIHSIYKL